MKAPLLSRNTTTSERLVSLADRPAGGEGKGSGSEEPVELAVLLEEVLAPFRQAAKAKGIAFEESWAAVPVAIFTDRVKVKPILRNLLDNAIKYTERGRIEVAVKTGNEAVEIAVRDTGIGIAAENLKEIFEIGGTHHGSRRPQGDGRIGLPVVKALLGLLGGHSHMCSRAGEGSEFTVCLPRDSVAAPFLQRE